MKTREVLDLLRAGESRNVTFVDPAGDWPIVWEQAKGVHVRDADGRRYLDLTGAFGVAAAGHANPRVVRAGQRQMARLLHAMGDVHPHAMKARLARALSRVTFERWALPQAAKVIFCNSGFEAVEAALKTAMQATGRPGVIAFEGAYHGLGYGTLNATHREHFRGPFRTQLRQFGDFVPFPEMPAAGHSPGAKAARPATLRQVEARVRHLFRHRNIGAILVEPIQVRGGVRVPAPGFLRHLRRLSDEHRALLILDEIYTGFGRTGKWFACEHERVTPDLVCLGKALTGGFPLSACVGRAAVMDAAWPASTGEAIHTSTFLGHPVGCAMALAQIGEIRRLKLVDRSARLGDFLLRRLQSHLSYSKFEIQVRGRGLLAGVELRRPDGSPASGEVFAAVKTLLHRGFILLPEGEHANVISFTPPLTISRAQLAGCVDALAAVLAADDA
jgi:4-aminobutyrate aminotransferase-like enzyme